MLETYKSRQKEFKVLIRQFRQQLKDIKSNVEAFVVAIDVNYVENLSKILIEFQHNLSTLK
jgi:hypothetical protein